MFRLFQLTLVLISLLMITCQKDNTPQFPEEHKILADVYVEILLLRERMPARNSSFLDSTRRILHTYQFTQEQYETSIADLNKDPELWEAFYRKIEKQLKQTESSPLSPPDSPSQNINPQ